MNEVKKAHTEYTILDCLSDRWSPYWFDPRELEEEPLRRCLEAARWSASSYNEQPWRFIVAERTDEEGFEKMLSCLMEANRAWASRASVLMVTVVSTTFQKNGKPNRVAEHDLGLAMGNFSAQATALGLAVHQMAGIDLDRAREVYGIPDGYQAVTAVAVGYPADPDEADNQLAERDQSKRGRKEQSEFVFQGSFGETWNGG